MSKNAKIRENSHQDTILGTVLVGRAIGRPKNLPVIYFGKLGIVKIGLKPVGKANSTESALALARARWGDRLKSLKAGA